MGCVFSKTNSSARRGTLYGRRNTLVTKPNINILVGEGIKFEDRNRTKIIFIFGLFICFYLWTTLALCNLNLCFCFCFILISGVNYI